MTRGFVIKAVVAGVIGSIAGHYALRWWLARRSPPADVTPRASEDCGCVEPSRLEERPVALDVSEPSLAERIAGHDA